MSEDEDEGTDPAMASYTVGMSITGIAAQSIAESLEVVLDAMGTTFRTLHPGIRLSTWVHPTYVDCEGVPHE